MVRFFISSIVLFALMSSCNPVKSVIDQFSKEPEVSILTRVIRTSIPLAYAANLAMNAARGDSSPQVTMLQPFDSFPCVASMKISVSSTHKLPVGNSTSGSILIIGYWSSADVALMSAFFTNCSITEGTYSLRNAAFIPVTRSNDSTQVVFASEDINGDSADIATFTLSDSLLRARLTLVPPTLPTDSSLAVSQNAWIVIVDNKNTSSPLYSMYGASQGIGLTPDLVNAYQAVMIGATIDPATCRLNPINGIAYLRNIKISSGTNVHTGLEMGSALFLFTNNHCTGRVKITLATGVYVGRTQSEIDMHLE